MDHSADKVTVSEFLMRKQGFQKGTGVTVNSPPVTAQDVLVLSAGL